METPKAVWTPEVLPLKEEAMQIKADLIREVQIVQLFLLVEVAQTQDHLLVDIDQEEIDKNDFN